MFQVHNYKSVRSACIRQLRSSIVSWVFVQEYLQNATLCRAENKDSQFSVLSLSMIDTEISNLLKEDKQS